MCDVRLLPSSLVMVLMNMTWLDDDEDDGMRVDASKVKSQKSRKEGTSTDYQGRGETQSVGGIQ